MPHQRFEDEAEMTPSAAPPAATVASAMAGRLHLHTTVQTAYDKEADQCYLFDLAMRCAMAFVEWGREPRGR